MKIINESAFKGSYKGKKTALFTLKNRSGMVVQITNFGGKIVSIFAPDKNGNFADVVLGFDTIDKYINGMAYFGAICGRYANRIAFGKFTIDGVEYQLPVNNGPNSLHGGPNGFNDQVFDTKGIQKTEDGDSIVFTYLSKDGEEGYPGNVKFTLTYTLTENNELELDFHATTDKATHVNICGHSFFNLGGQNSGSVETHEIKLLASRFTPTDDTAIPTGEILSVEGTPMDLRETTIVGAHIDDDYEQLKIGVGYDHNWVLDKPEGKLGLAAVYSDPASGRILEVLTTQPGIQLYTANWLDGSDIGKGNVAYQKRDALCLETQHFPDSPNKPQFPSTLLKPGDEYNHTCIYKFSVNN